MKIAYPFEFNEMLLTDKALDLLGFSEYWDGSGDFGTRTFVITTPIPTRESFVAYRIVEHDEKDDEADGYGPEPTYQPSHYSSPFRGKANRQIYFLHDLYEDISDNAPEQLEYFVQNTKKKGVNMWPFLSSYLSCKEKNKP